MKVVLFCGGFGMRLREYSESIPKPLVNIGNRPIIWHIMKYYAHYGHNEFILCLGWKANVLKQYFLQYDECISNDFVLSSGGKNVELLSSDIDDWKITFVDTGTHSNIGQRLKAVERHLDGEDMFLANYTDGLSDVDLNDMIASFEDCGGTASFISVNPSQSFHCVNREPSGIVTSIKPISSAGLMMNGGFFIFRNEFFDYLREGEELIEEPFDRLIKEGKLHSYAYPGFWSCMDTFKEKQDLDDLYAAGAPPWAVWQNPVRGRNSMGDRVAGTNGSYAKSGGMVDAPKGNAEPLTNVQKRHDLAPS